MTMTNTNNYTFKRQLIKQYITKGIISNKTGIKVDYLTLPVKQRLAAIRIRHYKANIMPLSKQIAIHSLNVLARGRWDEYKQDYVISNDKALSLLNNPYDGGNAALIDDITAEIALTITDIVMTNGKYNFKALSLQDRDGTVIINTDKDNMRRIFNVAQNMLYQLLQKHYKRLYIPVMVEDDEGNIIEDTQLYTKAMYDYDMSISNIHFDDIYGQLKCRLSDLQWHILNIRLYDSKIVTRTKKSTVNGRTVYMPVKKSVKLTNQDIADMLGIHVKTVQYNLDCIRQKLSNMLMDDGHITSDKMRAHVKPVKMHIYATIPNNKTKVDKSIPDICKGIINYYPTIAEKADDNWCYEAWLFNHASK